MGSDRWEHGSDFAYPVVDAPASVTLPVGATYWHAGRDALRALVSALRPDRVVFPAYYCQDVLEAVREDGTPVAVYASGLLDALDPDAADVRAGDLLVVSNTFGLRAKSPLRGAVPTGVIVVEDHTHDPFSPWARASSADYAFASLRKWLPLPDGGVLWSPRGSSVPAPPSLDAEHAAITLERLSAMLLKAAYLDGRDVAKDGYRALAVAGEGRIGRGRPAPMSPLARALLATFPVETWRAARRANHDRFVASSGALAGMEVLRAAETDVPFAVTLILPDAARRDAVRSALVAARIYPAVLWPIDASIAPGTPASAVDLSRRILTVHCDHRYTAADMDRVAAEVRKAAAA